MLPNHPYIDMVIDNANVATKEEKDTPCNPHQPPRIESSNKEEKSLNDINIWIHNDDWWMTELFKFLEMFNSSPKSWVQLVLKYHQLN